ncbi:aluminum-activated malate transporter 10 [Manihot esculenta]|uniref:Aluminum-activated malate transporter n=1 Tax=Manihot esculenta TaxID=3983 RepID=A0A2C9WQ72_MANES|nr:aluminum-activated malate transporter 10 [Manihot esculenta]
MGKEGSNKSEWGINIPDDTSEILVPESRPLGQRVWLGVRGLLGGIILKIWKFLEKAWNIGVAEPKKVIHGVKVGAALSLVSLFYYIRPLYEGAGGNAMWAVMTVVVVLEYTVGATLYKCINRATATFLAGSLGLGVHWVASQTGEKLEPVILGISLFIFASAATFSRFIPSVKARFDYGALIFILTFTLVSVSGYRVDELFDFAHQRLSTIVIGASLCILISLLFCPVWAGTELHNLTHSNLEKLSDSLDGCFGRYFTSNGDEDFSFKVEEYKCVLNSKATEESMANFARWEPSHGRFNFRHPWKQYLEVGASLRSCANCIQTLNGFMNSEIQAPEYLKKHLSSPCTKLSFYASKVLKELTNTVKTMTKPSNTDLSTGFGDMRHAAQELQNALKSLANYVPATAPAPTSGAVAKAEPTTKTSPPPVMEVLPLVTLISLLIETARKVEDIVDSINELARLAEFKPVTSKRVNQNEPNNKLTSSIPDRQTTKNPTEA